MIGQTDRKTPKFRENPKNSWILREFRRYREIAIISEFGFTSGKWQHCVAGEITNLGFRRGCNVKLVSIQLSLNSQSENAILPRSKSEREINIGNKGSPFRFKWKDDFIYYASCTSDKTTYDCSEFSISCQVEYRNGIRVKHREIT